MMQSMILPSPAESFVWTEFAGRSALVCTPLAEVAPHFFTTRGWPLGTGGTAARADDLWQAVADAAEVDIERLIRVRQVHGVTVVRGTPQPQEPAPAADIVTLRDGSLACAVQAADCVPLLIADRKTGAVAAVHCGWRGISLNAAGVAVAALVQHWGAVPANLIAAVGPSIGACCYEVGEDVRQRFVETGTNDDCLSRWFLAAPAPSDRNPSMPTLTAGRKNHWFFDGWRAVAEQLQSAGVLERQIFVAALCTASHPEVLCSYRRDGAVAGRQVGVIRSATRRP